MIGKGKIGCQWVPTIPSTVPCIILQWPVLWRDSTAVHVWTSIGFKLNNSLLDAGMSPFFTVMHIER